VGEGEGEGEESGKERTGIVIGGGEEMRKEEEMRRERTEKERKKGKDCGQEEEIEDSERGEEEERKGGREEKKRRGTAKRRGDFDLVDKRGIRRSEIMEHEPRGARPQIHLDLGVELADALAVDPNLLCSRPRSGIRVSWMETMCVRVAWPFPHGI
jgi:hypothetical protein